jgi:hypothetical protein
MCPNEVFPFVNVAHPLVFTSVLTERASDA